MNRPLSAKEARERAERLGGSLDMDDEVAEALTPVVKPTESVADAITQLADVLAASQVSLVQQVAGMLPLTPAAKPLAGPVRFDFVRAEDDRIVAGDAYRGDDRWKLVVAYEGDECRLTIIPV